MLTPMFMLHMNAFALHLHGTVLYCTVLYRTSLHPSLDYHSALSLQ